MDNIAFHNPTDFGVWDLAISQKDKIIQFSWDTDVLPNPKIVIGKKAYTVGNGLTRVSDRIVNITLQGADFAQQANQKLSAECNFFNEGDIEATFTLAIVPSKLG